MTKIFQKLSEDVNEMEKMLNEYLQFARVGMRVLNLLI